MRYSGAKTVILLAGVTILLAGCAVNPSEAPRRNPGPHGAYYGGSSSEGPQATDSAAVASRVVIDNFTYSPREITVSPGSRVVWVNHDDVPHTVTSTAKPKAFDSGALDGEESFSFVFEAPGTYNYFCAVHPHMTGRVIVK